MGCGSPVASPSAQLNASTMVTTSTADETANSMRVIRSRPLTRIVRQVSRATVHIPAVSTTAPASSAQSPMKYPMSTSRVPDGTLDAANRPAGPSATRQTSPAISAAANPAKWKWGTVSARIPGPKPKRACPERSATSAVAATDGVTRAVNSAISAVR